MAPTAQREEAPRAHEDEGSHSGRLLLRMPQSLHSELARAAEREGVSLNGFITNVLAGAVRWRASDGEGAPAPMRTAVVIDLVLVAVAALAAIALLVVSLF